MSIVFHGLTKSQKEWIKLNYPKVPVKFFSGQLNLTHLPPKNTRILSIHTSCKIDTQLLQALPNLELIITRTTGTDHINLASCRSAKVMVCNTAGQNAVSVAEFTMGLIISASRSIVSGAGSVRVGNFDGHQSYGFELAGKTLGVIGTGAIGSQVLKYAQGFGMEILAHDFHQNKTLARKHGFRYVSIKELFRKSDIVSLHIPGTPMTKKLINQGLLNLLKPGAGIVNTARGSIIDTAAVLKFLKSGRLSWYAADVLDDELGFSATSPRNLTLAQKKLRKLNQTLVSHPHTVITPHMAHATVDSTERIMTETMSLIEQFLQNKPIKTII